MPGQRDQPAVSGWQPLGNWTGGRLTKDTLCLRSNWTSKRRNVVRDKQAEKYIQRKTDELGKGVTEKCLLY